MKKQIIYSFLILLWLPLMAQAESLDQIIVTVNNNVITQSQLEDAMLAIRHSLSEAGAPQPANNVLRKQVLSQLITTQLQLQAAKEAQITVPEKEIDNAVKKIAEQNQMTIETFHHFVEQQGTNWNTYRKELHDQIMIQKAEQQTIAPTVKLTPEEAKADLTARKEIWYRKFNIALKEWISMLYSRATINRMGSDSTA